MALVLAALTGGRMAGAEELAPELELVRLHNGTNEVDLDGDGIKEPVIVAHRANFNAHSFDVTTIYLWTRAEGEEQGRKRELQIVPYGTKGPEELVLRTGGGADGLLNDFRLQLDRKNQTAVLITAEREFGASFADVRPVQFQFYRLTMNEEGVAGSPLGYFKPEKSFTSQKAYQDVGAAFERELKLGAGLIGGGEKP